MCYCPPSGGPVHGQLDIIVGVPLTESMLQVLQWSGRDAYLKADTQVSPLYTYTMIIMPRCACASEVYGSVFVCLSVCLCRLLQLVKDERSASKGFYRLLVMFSWILIRGFAK